MAIIDYPTRVHFGDGVLEEALRAEIEARGLSRPLVVVCADLAETDPEARLLAGLPAGADAEILLAPADGPTEDAAAAAAEAYRRGDRDHFIAFGAGPATDLAKLARLLVSHDLPLARFAEAEGGAQRVVNEQPPLVAAPGILGLASSLTGRAPVTLRDGVRADVASVRIAPTVAICDPTLVRDAPSEACASAGASAIARCVEAFLSPSYNPPADGIALDGLMRAARSLHRAAAADDLDAHRDIMAACLDGALVQQKGLGLSYAIGAALGAAGARVDQGAIDRLVLPGILRFQGENAPVAKPLRDVLGLRAGQSLADGLAQLMRDLPLPRSLAEMGVSRKLAEKAAALAANARGAAASARVAGPADILSIMQAVR